MKKLNIFGKFDFSTKHFFPQNIICFVEKNVLWKIEKKIFHCKYYPTRVCVAHDITYKVPWQSPQLDFKGFSKIDPKFYKKNIFFHKTYYVLWKNLIFQKKSGFFKIFNDSETCLAITLLKLIQ